MRHKILLLSLLVLAMLLTACGETYAMPSDGVIELPREEIVISVQLATDVFLSGYNDYLDLSWFEDGDLRIAFTSNTLVRGFSFIELGYDDGYYVENILIEQKELLSDRPLVVTLSENRGVSFFDAESEKQHFALEVAGDGGLFLVEF